MKKLTVKQHMNIANLFIWGGVIYDLYDMLVNGYALRAVPLCITLGLVSIGVVWRYTLVRCPHCGDKLGGIHSVRNLPESCPACGEKL